VVRAHKRLESWSQGQTTLNVVVGYDFTSSGDAALAWVASLKNVGTCTFTVAYVVGREIDRWGSGADYYSPSAIKDLIAQDLDAAAKRMLGDAAIKGVVITGIGRPDAQLVEFARNESADLLVIGTNQKRGVNLLGSVSRGVLHHASTNIICVPIGAAGLLQQPDRERTSTTTVPPR
jgi:nucleotide-binding universal stress UspA family protein